MAVSDPARAAQDGWSAAHRRASRRAKLKSWQNIHHPLLIDKQILEQAGSPELAHPPFFNAQTAPYPLAKAIIVYYSLV